jgi:hypothetical protein
MRYNCLFLLCFVLSACKKDTNPVNSGTGNNGGRDSSYGDASMSINDSAVFTCHNNFYMYDSVTHRLHLEMYRDSSFAFILSVKIDKLQTGVYDLPPDSGAYILSTVGSSLLPFRDTVHFVLTAYDPATRKFSASFWLHLGVPVNGVTGINNCTIKDAVLVILPYGDKPSFSATVSGIPFPDTPSYTFTTHYEGLNSDEWMTAEAGNPNGNFDERLIVKFTPSPQVTGAYRCDGVHCWIRLFTRHLKNFQQIDTNYVSESNTGILNISDYDKGRHTFSGSFSDTVEYYYDPSKKVGVTGVFKNMPLEPY